MSHFPIFLHDYIEDIIDVEANENYGFRAIRSLLEWGEESWSLYQTQLDGKVDLNSYLYSKVFYDIVYEVKSSLQISSMGVQDHEKWMTIPDIGYPIVFRYNVILVSLSSNFNINFFPLVVSPFMHVNRYKMIAIGFINNNN